MTDIEIVLFVWGAVSTGIALYLESRLRIARIAGGMAIEVLRDVLHDNEGRAVMKRLAKAHEKEMLERGIRL